MAIQIILSSISTTATDDHAIDVTAPGNVVLVPTGVVVAASGTSANGIMGGTLDGLDITVGGTVASQHQSGVSLGGDDNTLSVAAGGTILSGSSFAVFADGAGNVISSDGLIQSGDIGVELRGSASMTNNGSVLATNRGISLTGATESNVINRGSVTTDGDGIFMVSDLSRFENTGSVTAGGLAIWLPTVSAAQVNSVVNSGTLAGQQGAITGGAGQEIVRNHGDIEGDINLLSGEDRFILTDGSVFGTVDTGDGADRLELHGGSVSGTVTGGPGDDTYVLSVTDITLSEEVDGGYDTVLSSISHTLEDGFEELLLTGAGDIDGNGNNFRNVVIGNAGANRMTGENSRDTIDGGPGNDTIDGGRGGDLVTGGTGDDWLTGRAGSDYLDGGEDDDFLFGGIGADVMLGDNGDDTLKGGLGSDTMDGGGGSDVFVFSRLGDSPGGLSDRIVNYVPGEDAIDLTGLTSRMLEVSILGGFTGTGPSLRTFENSYGDTIVFVDADGDAVADMRIEVDQVTGLTESDFIV